MYNGEFGYAMDNDKFIKQEVWRNWIRQKNSISTTISTTRGIMARIFCSRNILYIIYYRCFQLSAIYMCEVSPVWFLVCIWYISMCSAVFFTYVAVTEKLAYVHDKSILYVSLWSKMVFCTLRHGIYIR